MITRQNEHVDDAEDPIDIKSLLAVANSNMFDESESLLRDKENFEKVDSFFDLIKSDPLTEKTGNSESSELVPTDENEIALDTMVSEEITPEYQDSALPGVNEQIVEEKKNSTSSEIKNAEASIAQESTETTENNETDQKYSDANSIKETADEGFETVNIVTESLDSASEQIEEENTQEEPEQSEEYQRGYNQAIQEFEATLESEKKAIAEFSKTLFAVREDLSKIVEEILFEKVKELGSTFLGMAIEDNPKLLSQQIKNISEGIIDKTSELVIELNEIDATAISEHLDNILFTIKSTPELGRGEFRIISSKSGYEQRILD